MLEIIEHTCAECGKKFESPGLGEWSYGEFLLRTERGSVAYVNAMADAAYNEVGGMLSEIPQTASLEDLERADILWCIYGPVACDPDGDGAAAQGFWSSSFGVSFMTLQRRKRASEGFEARVFLVPRPEDKYAI